MPLIIKQESTAPSVNDAVLRIKQINTELYNIMKSRHTAIYNLVWKNKDYTPQQILDAFGKEADLLFQLSSGIQQILKSADDAYPVLDPKTEYEIKPSADGTVVVTKTAVPVAEEKTI